VLTPDALVTAVEDMGFDAHLLGTAGQEEAVLAVAGMTCSACSSSVESALRAVPGVSAADVSVVTGKAQVGDDA
jgi:Cu+-exporting ATPase